MLIGVTGKKRAGKDSFAARLVEAHGFVRVAFADPLKATMVDLNPLVVIEYDEVGPLREAVGAEVFHGAGTYRLASIVKHAGWEAAKEVREVRRLLQAHGVAIRDHVGASTWTDAAKGRIEGLLSEGKNVVITDVRFPNELTLVGDLGGFHVHVDRPGNVSTDTHASETALEPYYEDADAIVTNGATLDHLAKTVDEVVEVFRHYPMLVAADAA